MNLTVQERQQLIELMKLDAFRVGDFVLASGKRSSYYFDGRLVTLEPLGSLLIGRQLLAWAREDRASRIGGPTLGADPMVTSVALHSALDLGQPVSAFIVRKEPKGHGAGGWFAGPAPKAGERVAMVDDTLTTGGSLLQALAPVRETGAEIVGAYFLLDREEGGRERVEAAGYPVRSIFTRSDLAAEQDSEADSARESVR